MRFKFVWHGYRHTEPLTLEEYYDLSVQQREDYGKDTEVYNRIVDIEQDVLDEMILRLACKPFDSFVGLRVALWTYGYIKEVSENLKNEKI